MKVQKLLFITILLLILACSSQQDDPVEYLLLEGEYSAGVYAFDVPLQDDSGKPFPVGFYKLILNENDFEWQKPVLITDNEDDLNIIFENGTFIYFYGATVQISFSLPEEGYVTLRLVRNFRPFSGIVW